MNDSTIMSLISDLTIRALSMKEPLLVRYFFTKTTAKLVVEVFPNSHTVIIEKENFNEGKA
jgi:hypothetical protein